MNTSIKLAKMKRYSIHPGKQYMGLIGDSRPSCVPSLIPSKNGFEMFVEGDVLYDSMLSAIMSAREFIWLETYIFSDDAVGQRFSSTLTKMALSGLEVRVHVDSAGSLLWGFDRIVSDLVTAGVKVKIFQRWSWRTPSSYNRRNHRKLLIIDGNEAYLGGFNIHAENSLREHGPDRWRDSHVKVRGKLAVQASALYEAFWQGDRAWQPEMESIATSVLLTNQNRRCRHVLHCLFLNGFENSNKFVYVTTPYFVPDYKFQQHMIAAAKRGVDVRLLVPKKGDVPLIHWASRAAYAPLLRAGVRIYEYGPRILHAKTAVIDASWASIGSANMDYRSFFLNYELNIVTRDTGICDVLQKQFLDDLEFTREIESYSSTEPLWRRYISRGIAWLARRWL